MNCPKCDQTMEEGILYSNRHLFWAPGSKKIKSFLRPKGAFRICPVGEGTQLSLSDVPQYPGASLCRACGVIVFPCQNENI